MSDLDGLFERARDGEADAERELFDHLYRELKEMAGRMFRSQRSAHTLQPTALVHEAFMKMARPDRAGKWQDRSHFIAVAARAMRQVLVNHARDKGAVKRGGPDRRQRVTLSGVQDQGLGPALDVLSVNHALEDLSKLDERQARVAELRLFGGLTNQETAEVVDVSLRSVELDWKMAKAWLAERLGST